MPVIKARFIRIPDASSNAQTLVGLAVPIRVELDDELVASCGLVGLADRFGRRSQSLERAQEATVLLVAEAHVARTTPSRLSQTVEAAVVADAEARVRLDVVACKLAEPSPGVEETGPARDDIGDRVASRLDRLRERGCECVQCV